jgi:hypothetical protein
MNKIILAMLIGLFAVGAYATEASKPESNAVKVHSIKHTAAPVKKAKQHKEVAAKKETPSTATSTK